MVTYSFVISDCEGCPNEWLNFSMVKQGRPQDLGGGGAKNFFFQIWEFALLGGFGGMLPRENFLKRCNLVRFRVYFDQILSLFFSKKCHFVYKK